jgi:hypothetical protein
MTIVCDIFLKYSFPLNSYCTVYTSSFPGSGIQNVEFPFSLSVLTHLEHLTISTILSTEQSEIDVGDEILYRDFVFYSAIHAIARLIEFSASTLRQVVLKFYCDNFSSIDSLIAIDWDPLLLLGQSPTCPHIDLHICCQDFDTGREFSLKEITGTLSDHAELMKLVNRGVFSVKASNSG